MALPAPAGVVPDLTIDLLGTTFSAAVISTAPIIPNIDLCVTWYQ